MSTTIDEPEYELSDDGVMQLKQYYPNGPDDYDIEFIPKSWLDDNGVRHAVIDLPALPEYMRLEKVDGKWKLNDSTPF